MVARVARWALFCVALALPAGAQEGYPLNGSWHGDWGAPGGKRTPVLLYMHWDSKNVTGAINPGPKAAPLKVVTLDPSNWTVHLEADAKDGTHIVADGKIDDLGSYHRTLSGTWMQGTVKGDFKVTRD